MKRLLFKLLFISSLLFAGLFVTDSVSASSYNLGNGVYCWDGPNGRAKCGLNGSEAIARTTNVIVNGWVDYGPWQPRPGFGIIW